MLTLWVLTKTDWRRYNHVLYDREIFAQIHADVQGFRVARYGRARCDRLLFGDRLGAFDGYDLHFDDGRCEVFFRLLMLDLTLIVISLLPSRVFSACSPLCKFQVPIGKVIEPVP
jgi:hypothetical protein